MVHSKRKQGFTLMEMLIVVAIIAVLAAIAIPAMGRSIHKAKESADWPTCGPITPICSRTTCPQEPTATSGSAGVQRHRYHHVRRWHHGEAPDRLRGRGRAHGGGAEYHLRLSGPLHLQQGRSDLHLRREVSRLRRIASYIYKKRVCDAMPQALFMCVGRPASRRNRPFSCVTRPVSTPRHVSASSPASSSMLRPVESCRLLTFKAFRSISAVKSSPLAAFGPVVFRCPFPPVVNSFSVTTSCRYSL